MLGTGALLLAPFVGLRSRSPGRVAAVGMASRLRESEQTGIFLYVSPESTG